MSDLICRLGYVALNVADYEGSVDDARNVLGLRLIEDTGDRAVFTANTRGAEYVLHRAAANAIRAVGLEACDAAAVEEVARRAGTHGMKILSQTPSLDVIRKSVTLETIEGHVFEVHTPVPNDQPRRHEGAGIHPLCIDHVNLKGMDPEAIGAQFEKVLGLKLSNMTSGREIVWYRAGDGRHHTVGIIKGDSGLHHISWEFGAFADFQRLGDILSQRDRRISWGPGRHGPGDNLFTYHVDASGVMTECCAEMERIYDPDFKPRIVDPGENLSNYKVLNQWGALPSAEWMAHHSNFAEYQG